MSRLRLQEMQQTLVIWFVKMVVVIQLLVNLARVILREVLLLVDIIAVENKMKLLISQLQQQEINIFW